MIIGRFKPTSSGGWSGTIRTLTINAKVHFVPNDNRENDRAPMFRIFVGVSKIGAAWQKTDSAENSRSYLSVQLDDPSLKKTISAAMFEEADGVGAQLVWNRRHGP